MDDDRIDLRWGRFALRVALGVAIMAGGIWGQFWLEDDEVANDLLAVVVVIAALAGVFGLMRVQKDMDEFQQILFLRALAFAGYAAVMYGAISKLIGESVVFANLGDLAPQAYPILGLPGAALLMFVLLHQFLIWNYARAGDTP